MFAARREVEAIHLSPSGGRIPQGSGFTLLEVILALAILSMITGTIYAIVSGSTQASIEIEVIQKENRRAQVFIEHLRRILTTMPGGAQIEIRVIEQDPLLQEFVIRGVPDAFLFGPMPVYNREEITLALRRPEFPPALSAAGIESPDPPPEAPGGSEPKAQERFYLALNNPGFFVTRDAKTGAELQPENNPLVVRDEKGRFWMELFPDLAALKWHYWDPGKKLWLDKIGPSRPQRLQLTLLQHGRSIPTVVVFELR